MSLSRRDFLRLMGGTAAIFAFPGVILQGCKRSLKKAAERTSVIWIQGQSCSGCSVSLLNKMDPDIASVITGFISLNFHQTIMGATGDKAIHVLEDTLKKERKDYILIVEGSIPTKSSEYCTIGEMDGRIIGVREWVEKLAKNAKAVVAVGSCAAFGGIPSAEIRANGDNPTGAKGVSAILPGTTVLNIPGCPPHPDWMVGALLHFMFKGVPELDEYNRPKLFFDKTVHEQCERLSYYKNGKFAKHWGDEGCLYLLGCLGIDTNCDIPARKWLNGTNSCTGSGSGCIGCTESVFPDFGKRGLYKHLEASNEEIEKLEHQEIRDAVCKLKKNGGVINV